MTVQNFQYSNVSTVRVEISPGELWSDRYMSYYEKLMTAEGFAINYFVAHQISPSKSLLRHILSVGDRTLPDQTMLLNQVKRPTLDEIKKAIVKPAIGNTGFITGVVDEDGSTVAYRNGSVIK